MDHTIPSAEQVRQRLLLTDANDLPRLAEQSGVPFHTLLKIRRGETRNPRIETVRMLWPHLPAGQICGVVAG